MKKSCFQCKKDSIEMYGYSICEACVSKLRLFTDKTIKEHITKYKRQIYEDDVNNKLLLLDETYNLSSTKTSIYRK